MNKKLLSLAISGVLALTSLPATSALATTLDTTNKISSNFSAASASYTQLDSAYFVSAKIYASASTSSKVVATISHSTLPIYDCGSSKFYAVKDIPGTSGWCYVKISDVDHIVP